MESAIKELYEVAQEIAMEGEYQQDKAFKIIELIEDGLHKEAIEVGLIY